MVFILHTTLYSLISYVCMVDTYSNRHVIHQIFSASIFWCSLMEMCAWDICEGRPLSVRLGRETPTLLTCYPSLQDQDHFYPVSLTHIRLGAMHCVEIGVGERGMLRLMCVCVRERESMCFDILISLIALFFFPLIILSTSFTLFSFPLIIKTPSNTYHPQTLISHKHLSPSNVWNLISMTHRNIKCVPNLTSWNKILIFSHYRKIPIPFCYTLTQTVRQGRANRRVQFLKGKEKKKQI